MPITPRDYQPVPYAAPARTVPNYSTLGELMGLRARNTQVAWAQIAQAFNNFVENRAQQQTAQAALAQRKSEQEAELQLKREAMQAAQQARDEAAQAKADAEREKAQAAAEKRGDARAKAIGYGPMAEMDVDTVMQSPERAGDVRYAFGPGTANGPELMPTPEQSRTIELEKAVKDAGGTIGPNGSVHYPEKPAARRPQAAMVNGRRAFVFFDEKGGATDMAGRPVQASPITPEGPAPERPSVWVSKGTEQQYVTPTQAAQLAAQGWGPSQTRENPSEDERKSYGFYKRMVDASRIMDEVEDKLTPTDIYQIQSLPQEDLMGALNRGKMSNEAKRYIRAMMQFTEARLRADSGAAISTGEYAADRQTYAKQYGETPELNTDRRNARQIAMEGVRARAARALPKESGIGKVKMQAPDGTTKEVEPSEVEHYKSLGAKVVGG